MKILFLVPILAFTPQMASAATFNLPKDAPLFSIAMPEKWITEEKGDVIVSRPAKDSKVNISVTPIPGAKNLEAAFAAVEKALSADYQQFSVDKASQEKEAGMDFLSAAGKGKKDGLNFRVALAAFSHLAFRRQTPSIFMLPQEPHFFQALGADKRFLCNVP